MISKKYYFFAAIIFAILSSVLIVSWFRYGLLYGGGDVGIPSYNPSRIIEIARYVWWDAGAPGNLVPHGITSLPVQFFQSALVQAGLPYFAVQATLFWILLFLMGYGMFLVGLSVFGKDKFKLSILCGLFYLLNPYMMIQVWHRFIHNSIFLAAFLPFFYLFWDDWIRRGRFVSILLFLLFNIFGVYLYGTIAFLLTVVFILSFIFLKHIFFPWQGINTFKKTTFRFIGGLTLWTLIHVWWILPTFTIAPAMFSAQHRIGDSLTTLVTLSRQTEIAYLISGINPFYLFEQADFGQVYRNPILLVIMFLPLLLLVPGFMVAVRSKAFCGWGILLVSAGLVAKGAAAPFGFIYIFAFTQAFVLGVLRNPFEKMGMLLPFSLAIIYTLGFKWYVDRFNDKGGKMFLGSLLFLQLGIFLWPMWSGKLIGKFDKLALVDVPAYYRQADDFLKFQKKEGKILHLPLTTGESVAYDWPYAFSGIESSQLLFTSLPSVSRGLNIGHVDDMISAAANIFRENPEDKKIISVLQNLNIRFLVLHKDIKWRGGFLDDPSKLEEILNNKKFLERKATFGDLIIYELSKEHFKPRIYTATQVNLLSRGEKNSLWPYLMLENNRDIISISDQTEQSFIFLQTIVVPSQTWLFHPKNIPLEKAIIELPAASKILPGSRLYFLIKLKEDFRILTGLGSEKMKIKLNFLGKRLVEAVRLREKGLNPKMAIQAYNGLLSEIFYKDNLKDQLDFIGGRGFVTDLFAKHLTILNTFEDAKQTKDRLLYALQNSELNPMLDVAVNKGTPDLEYITYHFQIPREDEYELLMADEEVRDVYQDKLEEYEFQIDGKRQVLAGSPANGFLSYGRIKLDSGNREITLAATPSANLFPVDGEIKVSFNGKESFETSIIPLTADTRYMVKFEAKILSGDKFKLQLIADGNIDYEKIFTGDNQNGWQSYREGILFSKVAATYAGIRFGVDEASDSVVFRNIRIERLLNNPIFLRSSNISKNEAEKASQVEFIQQSPVYYSGKIKLDKGGFIIFSESFHKDWQLRLFKGKGSFVPEERFLANMYANAWYIRDGGEYKFELEFTPQKTFYKGLLISISTLLFLFIFYLIKIKKWSKH